MGLYLIDLSLNTCLILSVYKLSREIKVQSLKYLMEKLMQDGKAAKWNTSEMHETLNLSVILSHGDNVG